MVRILIIFGMATAALLAQVEPPAGWRVDTTLQRFFTERPSVTVDPDGRATIHWSVREPVPGAKIHYGTIPENSWFKEPEFRAASSEEVQDSLRFRTHEIDFDVSRFTSRYYDVTNAAEHNEFTTYYRLEMFSPERSAPVCWDGRFHVMVQDGTYSMGITITEGPFIDCLYNEQAIISFSTDVPAKATVKVWGNLLPAKYRNTSFVTHHEIAIKKLKPGTTYTYSITLENEDRITRNSGKYVFQAEPEENREFSFAVLSDARGNYGGGMYSNMGFNQSVLRALSRQIWRLKPDFMVFAGDLINGFKHDPVALEEEYLSWKRLIEPIAHTIPVYEIPGNHEMSNYRFTLIDDSMKHLYVNRRGDESTEAFFASQFVNPVNPPISEGKDRPPYDETAYSFRYGNALFVAINTYYDVSTNPSLWPGNIQGNIMLKQLRWLDRTLKDASADGIQHIFVFGHHPGFPNGGHVGDSMYWNGIRRDVNMMRERFWSTLSRYDVDAYFCGHEHSYSRLLIDSSFADGITNPVYQITTGRAGAPFYTRQTDLEWSDKVEAFSIRNHFMRVNITGNRIHIEAIDINGEVFDTFEVPK